jgi:hypothetical protein
MTSESASSHDRAAIYNTENNRCECRICKETFQISFPISMSMFADVLMAFNKNHQKCEVPNADRN